jgi:hypothetical protein
VEGLNKLWPKENIKRTTFDSIKLDADIIFYLTSLNVDVFGWIEQGLAVDAEYNYVGAKPKVLYTEEEVEELLKIQRGNCYVAILTKTRDENLATIAGSSPEPSGGKWRK